MAAAPQTSLTLKLVLFSSVAGHSGENCRKEDGKEN